MVIALPAGTAARLGAAPFTYAEVGATVGPLPDGYRHVHRSRALPSGDLDAAVERLMTWQVQQGAGLHVAASSPRVAPEALVEMRLGPPLVGVRVPCRIVEVIDGPDEVGFAYGTLPGHPESGEERFVVRRDAAGSLTFTITAFSRPASVLSRVGGPVARRVQDLVTERYLRAIDG